ncbi:MAG: hypothetical protein QOD87_2134 [Pseudonocardiales bacterium]|nr:hypothetical protein [Pseudonocardiales bacterium]
MIRDAPPPTRIGNRHRRVDEPRPRRQPRRSRGLGLALAVLAALVAVGGNVKLGGPVAATAPFDHRSVAPNQSSEMPGTGYLLTDPLQGASAAYWAGAYRSIDGIGSAKAYCIDDFYDYPNHAYGYRTTEVSSWPGRAGSNSGASGHAAQRIIWIVNSYGQSASPVTTSAVSMAINLLTRSKPFMKSYDGYFKAQLARINPAIGVSIDQMLADSDRFAGPYATRIIFGAAPAPGGTGTFAVSIRSASGAAVRNAPFVVTEIAGGKLVSKPSGNTGVSGVARLTYRAGKAGAVAVTAHGTAVPATTMRLGYSPTHNTPNFNTGSQRLAVASATHVRPAPAGRGSVVVAPPLVTTAVMSGTGPRILGTPVSDLVTASGLVPRTGYSVTATLLDSTGVSCGRVSLTVTTDALGGFTAQTPTLPACGTGTNTFVESIADLSGTTVAITPAGQPSETFPVTPVVAPPPPTTPPASVSPPPSSTPPASVAPPPSSTPPASVSPPPVIPATSSSPGPSVKPTAPRKPVSHVVGLAGTPSPTPTPRVLAQTGATPSLAAVAGSVIFAVGIGALWLAGRRPRR